MPNALASDEVMHTSTTINMQRQPQTGTERSQDEVPRRAYQLWEGAGRPSGRDLEHWLQAEAELLRASQPHHADFGTSDSDPARAIEPAKEQPTPAAAASRRRGPKLRAGSRKENDYRVATSGVR